MARSEAMGWALIDSAENRLDGRREGLAGVWPWRPDWHKRLAGHGVAIYHTRAEARAAARAHNEWLAGRDDLQREPHGWKPRRVVKVRVTVETVTR